MKRSDGCAAIEREMMPDSSGSRGAGSGGRSPCTRRARYAAGFSSPNGGRPDTTW